MIGRGFAQGAAGAGARFGGGYGRTGGGFARHGMPFGGALAVVFGLIVLAVVIFAFWKLFEKAGYHGALSLLVVIPIVGVGLLLWLALSEWPVHAELAKWRTWYASTAAPSAPVVPVQPEPVAAPVTAPVEIAPPVFVTAPEPPVKKTKK